MEKRSLKKHLWVFFRCFHPLFLEKSKNIPPSGGAWRPRRSGSSCCRAPTSRPPRREKAAEKRSNSMDNHHFCTWTICSNSTFLLDISGLKVLQFLDFFVVEMFGCIFGFVLWIFGCTNLEESKRINWAKSTDGVIFDVAGHSSIGRLMVWTWYMGISLIFAKQNANIKGNNPPHKRCKILCFSGLLLKSGSLAARSIWLCQRTPFLHES